MSAAYHGKDALRIEAAALVLVKNAGSHLTYTISETPKTRPKPRPTVPELHKHTLLKPQGISSPKELGLLRRGREALILTRASSVATLTNPLLE